MSSTSLILLSGGLDSVYAFLKAREETHILYAISFDYGQRARERELTAAKKICEKFGVRHRVIALPFFSELAAHPLLGTQADCPALKQSELDDPTLTHQSAKAVWVPNRNGLFLNVAAALAEADHADHIYVGFNAEEGATFPDNSPEFVSAVNQSLSYSTLNHVTVVTPPIALVKTEIVAELKKRDFDFGLLWSCYLSEAKMCGRCESCMRLKRALEKNNLSAIVTNLFSS